MFLKVAFQAEIKYESTLCKKLFFEFFNQKGKVVIFERKIERWNAVVFDVRRHEFEADCRWRNGYCRQEWQACGLQE